MLWRVEPVEGRLAEEAKGPVGGLAEKGSRKVDEQAEPRATVVAVRPTLLRPVQGDRSRLPFAATELIAYG